MKSYRYFFLRQDIINLFLMGGLFPALGVGLSAFLLPDFRLDHTVIYIIVESTGALMAFLSILFISHSSHIRKSLRQGSLIWMIAGLLGMGVLDTAHVLLPGGNMFVWLHSLSTLLGGGLFACVWVWRKEFLFNRLPLFTFIGCIVLIAFSMFLPEHIPLMLEGRFLTPLTKILSIAGALGFFAGAAYFLKIYRIRQARPYYFLSLYCLLFASSSLIFTASRVWDLAWWLEHILRLAGYSILIFYFALSNGAGGSSRKKAVSLNSVSYFLAGVLVLLAASVIWGWITDNRTLVQLFPHYAPMQLNTALCFLLCGIAVLTHKQKVLPIAEICVGLVITIAGLTSLEYLFDVTLGIDEFFMKAHIHTKVSHSGRMAPNTALSFLISGAAILFIRRRRILLVLASALLMVSGLAISGYFFNVEGLYGLGSLTRMALHTCIGFILLSSTFFILQRREENTEIDLWEISPAIILVIFMTLTVFSWYTVSESYHNQNREYFKSLVLKRVQAIEKRFSLYEQSLLGGRGFFNGSQEVSRQEWKIYVESLGILENLPGNNGLGFIDVVDSKDLDSYVKRVRRDDFSGFKNYPKSAHSQKFIIRYIEPLKTNYSAVGLDVGFEANRRAAAEEARDTGQIRLTKKVILVQDNKRLPGFLLLLPVYKKGSFPETVQERREAIKGWVYSPFMGRKFLSDLELEDRQVNFAVYDGDKIAQKDLIYQSSDMESAHEEFSDLTLTTQINLGGREWTIFWQPSLDFVPKQTFLLPSVFLVLAIITTIFFSGVFFLLSKLYGVSAQALESNRKTLTKIFENAADGIVSFNERGQISNCNRAAEAIFQYSEGEMNGINIRALIPDLFSSQPNEALDAKKEQPAYRKGGAAFEVEISISGVLLDNELIYTAIVRDITKRKQMERMKDEFVSMVSHELRTPLASIQGAIVLLTAHLKETLIATDRKLLKISRDNCERLIDLVNDILDMEKISAGKIEYTMESVEMCALVRDVVELNQGYGEKHKIIFQVTSAVESVYCRVDKTRFGQALANLLSNAAKFSPEDEVVRVHVAVQGEEAVISVSDKGPGIPKSFHKSIFDKFSQADSSVKRAKGGTGLGLNITKSFIEAFNGRITFETEEGRGTTFYLILPLASKKSQSEESEEEGKVHE